MSFSTPAYLVFLIPVLLGVRLLRTSFRMWLVLVASFLFFGWLDWRFCLLLVGIALVNWYGARVLDGRPPGASRKAVLTAAVAIDVATLGVFKYLGFFEGQVQAVTHLSLPEVRLIVPLGISFVTFQMIAYVVDVYREQAGAATLAEVTLLAGFFPHAIAGPLLKPRDFFEQVRSGFAVTAGSVRAGSTRFLVGLVKKVVIADRLGVAVDTVFHTPLVFSQATVWLAVLAYSGQIYCDFSGYTDMAIGSAQMMGLRLPENFNWPYLSLSTTEFWRRWHITLSTWLREYLYIPLGGNRRGRTRQAVNLMLTFLIAGLWHGAGWNFLIWGGLQGAGLVTHKYWSDWDAVKGLRAHRLWTPVAWLLTFGFVTFAWVFFRTPSISAAAAVFARMFGLVPGTGIEWFYTGAVLSLLAIAGTHVARVVYGKPFTIPEPTTWTTRFAFSMALIGVLVLMPTQSTPFIYFQF